ncbi:hypothetical protein L6452_09597 [Arctium lappa]|uniref:Uncharacterized protein n=1 Tax=Arctium lappa TaxID=4217 RepID=A0ACB9DKS9_ARCLA|nr:hypothetical protein L6452_09597 [Arctium lappa]
MPDNMCSQNRADELKSEESHSDCGNTSSGSVEGLGKVASNMGSIRTNLCPNWNKMSREEKRAYVKAEELKRKDILRAEMARKRELERVKKFVGNEVFDQDLLLTMNLFGVLDVIGKDAVIISNSSDIGDAKIDSSPSNDVGSILNDGKKMDLDAKLDEKTCGKRKGIDDIMNFDNSKFEEIVNPNVSSSNLPNIELIEKLKRGLEEESARVDMYDGTWNVVRRRRAQNRSMEAQGRQNGGIQGGGAVGKKDGVKNVGRNQVEAVKNNSGAAGPSGTKSVVDHSKNVQKVADKGKNVQGNEPVVRMDYKPVAKPLNAKKNANGENTNEVEIKNKFDVLNKIPLGVTKEAWELQKKTADIWLELKNEPPDHIRETWSKARLDYFYARRDFKAKMGDDVLPNNDAPEFMNVDDSILGSLSRGNDPVIQQVSS